MKNWLSTSTLALALVFSTTAFAATATPTQPLQAKTPSAARIAVALGKNTALIPQPPESNAGAYVIEDFNTGQQLAVKNENDRMAPASLTKIMTLYVISHALKQGQIHLDDKVRISKKAWKAQGSKMFVRVGTTVPVEDLVKGIIVDSGNDACIAMSEHVAGSEDAFVNLMNQQATQLGLKDTHFTDCTGMPSPEHYTTPHDIAVLARALIKDFPQYYGWYKEKWFTYNNIKQPNRNRLLWRDASVDGLKTGHTDSAGYCLVASALRDNTRLISVVMKAPSDEARAQDSQQLLTYGFRFFQSPQLFAANKALATERVWGGENKTVALGVKDTLFATIPNGQQKDIKTDIQVASPLKAPIQKGQVYGHVTATLHGQTLLTAPLVALTDDPAGGFWTRTKDAIGIGMHHLFGAKHS